MSIMLREGPIKWTRDLNAVTTDSAVPTGATDGVAIDGVTSYGSRLHVLVDMDASTICTATIHLYGHIPAAQAPDSAQRWAYAGSLNRGVAISGDSTKWSALSTSTDVTLVEQFTIAAGNFDRVKTKASAVQGSTVTITTWIGVPT